MRTFSNENIPNEKKLVYITDSHSLKDKQFGYYSWKTVKENRFVFNTDSTDSLTITSFRTITNSDIRKMSIDKLDYIQEEGNLLVNYLFFLDDHRCLYLSEDDARCRYKSADDGQYLRLHYDKWYYRLGPSLYGDGDDQYMLIQSGDQCRYKQVLRGYYSVEKDSIITIDFGDKIPFYFKGKLAFSKEGKVSQLNDVEVSVPTSPSLIKQGGISPNTTNFSTLLDSAALPKFELVETDIIDKYNPKSFQLTFGFKKRRKFNVAKNDLHQKILDSLKQRCPQFNATSQTIFVIEKVKYNYQTKQRIYTYRVVGNDSSLKDKKFTVSESIKIESFKKSRMQKFYRRARKRLGFSLRKNKSINTW
jgi:hypothetical protein